MTVDGALREGRDLLRRGGVPTPGLDAELLLAYLLGLERSVLLVRGDAPVEEGLCRAYRALLARRIRGECVACLTGRREFYGLDFTVTPDVLVPQPDTETLVEAALAFLRRGDGARPPGKSPRRVLDLCTGSGAVAIALKHEMPELEVYASDLSDAALACAVLNGERLLGSRDAVRFFHADLFTPIPDSRFSGNCVSEIPYSLILSNPPYIASDAVDALPPEVRSQPRMALDGGPGGLALLRRIIAEAGEHLLPRGGLFLEADPGQMPALREALAARGFAGIACTRDLAGEERVIGCTSP